MPKKVRGEPPRYLTIQGSGVKKVPVQVVAMYSGGDAAGYLDEFRRRYGYMDHVVLQSRDADGQTRGRVYAWKGNSIGANTGLASAAAGAKGQILDEKGNVLFAGAMEAKHDLVSLVEKHALSSPDGSRTARLFEAGYPGANLLLVREERSGKETRWQAGSRTGDLYLDLRWHGGALLTTEGRPDDQLLFQTHEDGHFISEVLGPDQMREDGNRAGLDLGNADPVAVSIGQTPDGVAYRVRFSLADGSKVERDFTGRFQTDAGGFVRLVDRH